MGAEVKSRKNGLFTIPIEKLKNGECLDGIDIALQIPGYHNIRYDYEDAPVQDSADMHWYEFTVPEKDGEIYVTI